MVCVVIDIENISLVCVQETKLDVIDNRLVDELLGTTFDYFYVSAHNIHGGILLA